MREPSVLLFEILARRVPPTGRSWQARVEEITGVRRGEEPDVLLAETLPAFDSDGFLAAFTATQRWLGKSPVVLDDGERGELRAAGVGWAIEGWHLDDLGRVSMLATVSTRLPLAELELLLGTCYRQGDSRERQALLLALPFVAAADQFVALAIDACRTNELPIFEAIACDNPYPADHFPDLSFNQMVLKSMFLGVSLRRIVGLERRRSSELERMANDYASERRAAGRSVPADIALLSLDPGHDRGERSAH